MKHIIITVITLLLSVSASAQAVGAQTQQFFQLPIVPDSIKNFQNRCDYMITHYWDFCDLKKAFSSRDKMADAFNLYLSFMPYASATSVYASVNKFMDNISKKPDDVLFIAGLAENNLFADTAQFQSEELYSLFLDNVLKNKKLNKQQRERYEKQSKVLHNSQEGMIAPDFEYTDLNGTKQKFTPDTTKFATILMFVVPGDPQSDLDKIRLDADIKTSQLVKSGRVRIVCIAYENGDGSLSCPEGWETGYALDVNEIYDVRHTPRYYILNSDGKILRKGSEVEPVLNVMQLLRVPKKKPSASQE